MGTANLGKGFSTKTSKTRQTVRRDQAADRTAGTAGNNPREHRACRERSEGSYNNDAEQKSLRRPGSWKKGRRSAIMSIIEVKDLTKVYVTGDIELRALDGVSFKIERGEFVCVMGPSGSGKSTMMNILGCLDVPTSGHYELDGVDVKDQTKAELADIRNQKLGFVFQGFNLLPKVDAVENVELPLLYRGVGSSARRKAAVNALERVGLGQRLHHRPAQMSGGQQQRVAIARAIVGEAPIILADEPTGNLDTKTTVEIMNIFTDLHNQGITVILVTHEPEIATWSERVLRFRDGKLIADEAAPKIEELDSEARQ